LGQNHSEQSRQDEIVTYIAEKYKELNEMGSSSVGKQDKTLQEHKQS
jgi:hypothetical protein